MRTRIAIVLLSLPWLFSVVTAAEESLPVIPQLQTWQALAMHAGLVGIGPKTKADYKVDTVVESKAYLHAAKAAIKLTDAEWKLLNGSESSPMLRFYTGVLTDPLWKGVVQLGYPGSTTVDDKALTAQHPACVLLGPRKDNVRVYILHQDKDGKNKTLYYFYNAECTDLVNPLK